MADDKKPRRFVRSAAVTMDALLLLLLLLLLSTVVALVASVTVDRCDLARDLRFKYKLPAEQISQCKTRPFLVDSFFFSAKLVRPVRDWLGLCFEDRVVSGAVGVQLQHVGHRDVERRRIGGPRPLPDFRQVLVLRSGQPGRSLRPDLSAYVHVDPFSFGRASLPWLPFTSWFSFRVSRAERRRH